MNYFGLISANLSCDFASSRQVKPVNPPSLTGKNRSIWPYFRQFKLNPTPDVLIGYRFRKLHHGVYFDIVVPYPYVSALETGNILEECFVREHLGTGQVVPGDP